MKTSKFRYLLGYLAALSLVCLMAGVVLATEVDRRPLELKVGGSDLVNTIYPFKRVSIANPEVADVVVISPRVLYVYGRKSGYTSVVLWEEGKGQTLLDVVVSLDLTGLKKQIHELYPDQQIEVHSSETGVVLSGTVSGPEIVEQVLRLTKTFLPKLAEGDESQEGSGNSGTGVTNLLQVSGIQQVMLEVKFAEVNRSKGKEWQAGLGFKNYGENFTGGFSANSSVLNPLNVTGRPIQFTKIGVGTNPDGSKFTFTDYDEFSGIPGQALLNNGTPIDLAEGLIDGLLQSPNTLFFNFVGNAANIFLNLDDFSAALNLMEDEGLAKTLAEPRLVTQSGQEASFLAGGEFPIPVPQDNGNITIQYKEFGVALVFTPVVLSDGRISLRVAPSVSEVVGAQAVEGFVVPNLSTRKLETTVQLQDGQTLALAGLLQDNFRDNVSKIPGLGDLPILGSLFRSTNYLQEKTELMIAVTPHLVKPVAAGSLKFPGEDLQPPGWYEFYLEGRLEGRRSGGASSASMESAASEIEGGGLEGSFGYQPVAAEDKGE